MRDEQQELLAMLLTSISLFHAVSAYQRWLYHKLDRMQWESRIIETACGPVECCVYGSGPAVLINHGSPGGYDQALALAQLIGGQYTYILPSRPGYLRTPLASGSTPEEQADLYVALLDTLAIPQTAIIGFSGGGPSALQFALRHPDRCQKLVMISGVAKHYTEEEVRQKIPPWRRSLMRVLARLVALDPFLYLVFPLALLLPGGSASIDLFSSSTLYRLRKTGYENDLLQFEALTTYPLEEIRVRSLIIHGTTDTEVPFEHAEQMITTIPGAQLLAIKGGDHTLLYTHSKSLLRKLRPFLQN